MDKKNKNLSVEILVKYSSEWAGSAHTSPHSAGAIQSTHALVLRALRGFTPLGMHSL